MNIISIKSAKNLKKIAIKASHFLCKSFTEKTNKTPEDALLGFILIFSLAFGSVCVASSRIEYATANASAPKSSVSEQDRAIKKLVEDYPISEMAPYINRKDEQVAAFLIAIAKKESNWGVHSPKKNGKDCYNYFGYRGKENPTKSGYSCFGSPKEAAKVVGGRIEDLIEKDIDSPKEMLVWKCGAKCNARTGSGAAKWVSDVNLYYTKIHKK